MPIKDWGIGLEELTEYYHRYGLYHTDNRSNRKSENWFMTRGLVDQSLKYRKSVNGKEIPERFPIEIDLVGLRIDEGSIAEVRLIQCKESVTPKMIKELERSFRMPRMTDLSRNAEMQEIFTRYVSCVNISKNTERALKEYGIDIMRFDHMVKELLGSMISMKNKRRKGFSREPILWMIYSLMDKEFFDKELIKTIKRL